VWGAAKGVEFISLLLVDFIRYRDRWIVAIRFLGLANTLSLFSHAGSILRKLVWQLSDRIEFICFNVAVVDRGRSGRAGHIVVFCKGRYPNRVSKHA
jgi:hypothetical protein